MREIGPLRVYTWRRGAAKIDSMALVDRQDAEIKMMMVLLMSPMNLS
jgi:hypothetical protein